MRPISTFFIAAFVAGALIPASVLAEDARHKGVLVDGSGNVVRSGSGLCWQHRDADQPANSSCDPAPKPIAAAQPAPRPAVVASPAPAPQPQAAKALPQKISFSGDALFDFDKSDLKPEGKELLDRLARELEGASYDSILAVGHTDRFGNDEYNQRLSERRANAVKEYLVSRNVPAGRIDAQGKGEMQPVTKSDDCRGGKSAKVVACLQPDRRVDIEMTGTKIVAGTR